MMCFNVFSCTHLFLSQNKGPVLTRFEQGLLQNTSFMIHHIWAHRECPYGGHALEHPSHPHVSNSVIVPTSYGCGGAHYLSPDFKSGYRLNRSGDPGTIGYGAHLSLNCHIKYKGHNPLGSSLGTSLSEM